MSEAEAEAEVQTEMVAKMGIGTEMGIETKTERRPFVLIAEQGNMKSNH
jgi:hypothetical protein